MGKAEHDRRQLPTDPATRFGPSRPENALGVRNMDISCAVKTQLFENRPETVWFIIDAIDNLAAAVAALSGISWSPMARGPIFATRMH